MPRHGLDDSVEMGSPLLPAAAAAATAPGADRRRQREERQRDHQRRCCAALRFIVPCIGELIVNACWRAYRSCWIKLSRSCCDKPCLASCAAKLPAHINDVDEEWLAAALGYPGMLTAISKVPLAIDEGFTSSLYIASLTWSPAAAPAAGQPPLP